MLPKTNATVLPGKILSQFTLPDYQMAEDYFAQCYLANVGKSTVGLSIPVARLMLDSATQNVAKGNFKYGTPGFDIASYLPTNLPFLLWLSLSKLSPMTREQAAALISPENFEAVSLAVLDMVKYDLPNAGMATAQNAPPPATTTTSPSPSTGPDSSAPSAPAASVTPTPAG